MHAIPSNGQSFKQLSINSFDFRDSMGFLPGALSKIVEDLHVRRHNFPFLTQSRVVRGPDGSWDKERFEMLLISKGIFPYERMRKIEDLARTALPSKDEFFSRLTNKGITDEEYQQAEKTFRLFQCKDMGEYMKLYCLTGK